MHEKKRRHAGELTSNSIHFFLLSIPASSETVIDNGGSVDSKVDPKEWKNTLTVTSDFITLSLKDGKKLQIPPKSVTSLSYGQEAHRRVGTMIALAI